VLYLWCISAMFSILAKLRWIFVIYWD